MAIFVQPMQPPLEQPLKGRPTGPFYVTLVESTLFDGSSQVHFCVALFGGKNTDIPRYLKKNTRTEQ